MADKYINLCPYIGRVNGILLAFRLRKSDPNLASMFVKKLYGQPTSSHGGKYRYRRKGLLDDIPHRKLIRGVIVVREEDAQKVVSFLKDFDTEFHRRVVELTLQDIKELGL